MTDPFAREVEALQSAGFDADWCSSGGNCMNIYVELGDQSRYLLINGIFQNPGETSTVNDFLQDREGLVGFTIFMYVDDEWVDSVGDDGYVEVAATDLGKLCQAVKDLAEDATNLAESTKEN